jgi:predicted flap endonuclease-1-like 5' DNA nuclease
MAWLSEFPGMGAAEDRATKAMLFPVGAASPLWLAFGAAASAGVAWWLLTRMTRPANLEALLPRPPVRSVKPIAIVAEPADAAELATAPAEVLEAVVEAAAESAVATVETVNAAVAEMAKTSISTAEAVAEAADDGAAEVAAIVEAAAEPVVEPAPAAPDDLTLIVGIGPKLAASLAERGVTTFAQLAAWTAKDLAEADAALSLKGRAVRDAWVAQAKRFAAA